MKELRVIGAVAILIALASGLDVVATHDAPGSITQATTTEVCAPGYATRHRPGYAYTWMVKRMMTIRPAAYELDHVVPLELGGSPYDLNNIQLQPWPDARVKDRIEDKIHAAVCNGLVTLKQGQEVFLRHE